jgi:hypothetical protein
MLMDATDQCFFRNRTGRFSQHGAPAIIRVVPNLTPVERRDDNRTFPSDQDKSTRVQGIDDPPCAHVVEERTANRRSDVCLKDSQAVVRLRLGQESREFEKVTPS